MEKRIIPAFATEAEEAKWWYEHREEITQELLEAVRTGSNGPGTRGRLQQIQERRAKVEEAAPHSADTEQFVASVE